MNKASAAALILALVFLGAATIAAISPAEGNPVPYPPSPSTELPTLTVQIPANNSEVYASDSFNLTFTVTKPASWDQYQLGIPVIGTYSAWVYLDEELIAQYYDQGTQTQDFIAPLNDLTSNPHTLQIDVRARAFYLNPSPSPNQTQYLESINNVTDIINFTLDTENKTLIFTEENSNPPQPSPTAEPAETSADTPTPSTTMAQPTSRRRQPLTQPKHP